MATQELSNKLTSALKDYLKSRGYIDSGKLYNSIKFTVSDNPFDIKLDAEPYIKYLDNGKLVDNFFNLESTTDILLEYFLSSVEDTLNKIDI